MKNLYRHKGLWQVETFSEVDLDIISGLDRLIFFSPARIKLPTHGYDIIVQYAQNKAYSEDEDIEFVIKSGMNFGKNFLVIAKGFSYINSTGREVVNVPRSG